MSGFPYPPPSFSSEIYNPDFYISSNSSNGYLTYAQSQPLIGVIPGTASASKALVLDSSRNISNIGDIQSTTTLKVNRNSTNGQTINCVNGTSTVACYQFASGDSYFGTTTNSTFHLQTFNAARLTILGSGNVGINQASPSYLFDVNGSARIVNNLTVSGSISGVLANSTQSGIVGVGTLQNLMIGSSPVDDAYLSVKGSSLSSYLDGNYSVCFKARGGDATPVHFQIECDNRANTTTTNATWIGNVSNNDLKFGCNNQTKMTIAANNGYVGVNTQTPTCPLTVSGSQSISYGAGGGNVYLFSTSAGSTGSSIGPISYNTAITCGAYISTPGLITTSDQRLKTNIREASIYNILPLFRKIRPKIYSWIESENRPGVEIGFIAQDLAREGFSDLIGAIPRPEMKEDGNEPKLSPEGIQLSVRYDRVSVYNFRMIQDLLARIDQLEAKLAEHDW